MNLFLPHFNFYKQKTLTDEKTHEYELPKLLCQCIHWDRIKNVQLDYLSDQKTFLLFDKNGQLGTRLDTE